MHPRKCRQVTEVKEAIAKLKVCETTFECRCCGDGIHGTSDGRFGYDDRGPWRRIVHIDGPNAICPVCVADRDCLDRFVRDGYDNAAIAVNFSIAWGTI